MPITANPDIKQELKEQLFTMSPLAFEMFAGDFLTYVGMENVSVSKYRGDAGIDAHGDFIMGVFRLPAGVQVKRHRNNIQRPDMAGFIGYLGLNNYSQARLWPLAQMCKALYSA